jgi:hypothetical protein
MTAKTTTAVTVTASVIKVVAAISAAATPQTPAQISTGGSASVTFFQLEGVCRFPVLPGIASTGLGENYRSHSQHSQGRNNGNLRSLVHLYAPVKNIHNANGVQTSISRFPLGP